MTSIHEVIFILLMLVFDRVINIIGQMIRCAEFADFEAIAQVRESVALEVDQLQDAGYRVKIQQQGFLLPTGLDVESFQADLSNYSVAEQEGAVIGYVRLGEDHEMTPETEAAWLMPDLKDTYYSSPHALIKGIGVLPESKKRGLATEMLEATEQRLGARGISWLFSEIVVSPVTNLASMMFHERNGFERIALIEPTEYVGLKGFQNLMYGERLQ